jgi:hypothetical protein
MPKIINVKQGTEEWFLARCGKVTASEFKSVLASGKGSSESKTRRTYMLKILGEILTGRPADKWAGNEHTERGHEDEPIARILYESFSGNEVKEVGMIESDCGKIGYSPDGICGLDGLVEIKSKMPHIHLDVLLKDEVPPEHMAQLQGGLMVSQRAWIDFVSYSEGLPLFVKRVNRDEEYIANLSKQIDLFFQEMNELKTKIASL